MARAVDLLRGFLTDDGYYSDTLPDRQVAQTMMQNRRQQEMFDRMDAAMQSPYPQVATNLGPLADPAMDGLFGAMAMRDNASRMKGGRFAVDYMGRMPGEGFGFYKANVNNGVSYNLADPQAGSDLARAAAAAQKAKEEQEQQAVQPRETDFGIFGRQGASQEVQDQVDADLAAERKPPQTTAPTPAPKKQQPQTRQRAPMRRYSGGSYTSPR